MRSTGTRRGYPGLRSTRMSAQRCASFGHVSAGSGWIESECNELAELTFEGGG